MIRRLSLAIALGVLLATTSTAFAAKDRMVVQDAVPTSRELVSLGPQPEPPDRPPARPFDPFGWILELLFGL
jgi:hypothetical protein